MKSIHPANGKLICEYEPMTDATALATLGQVEQAFQVWREEPIAHRGDRLNRVAGLLREQQSTLARCITDEMGKVLRESAAEIEKCAWCCEYFAANAEVFLADQAIATDAPHSYVCFQPLGTILAVMPWNFPFWQVFRFAAPALMAGNTAVLKHADNVCGCAQAIESIFREAGLPENVFRTLLIESKQVDSVIRHPSIKAVTLTGSTGAGQHVATQASACLKKSVLELGGSDPYIVLHDADLDLAVDMCVKSRLINAGQSCIAAKRFIIEQPLYEAFVEKFVAQFSAVKVGAPYADASDIGPLASVGHREALHKQVVQSVEKGARCLCGGALPEGEGSFYPPTVLAEVRPGMAAFDEETFGPVAAMISAADETAAIALANQSNFGLGAAIFTRDLAKGERIAKSELEAGACCVNSFVKSDPRLPFGGVKGSGFGRELASFGIREFVNIKSVVVG